MAPKKRKADETPVVAPGRVTRSSTRKASETEISPVTQPEKKKRAEPKATKNGARAKKVKADNESELPEALGDETEKETRTIVIEHCKQCRSFLKRAEEAKAGLSKGVSGIKVVFNPDKPRRGCFEIREEGGEKFVTLLELKRPFKAMKNLDMDKVVEDIIKKINC